MRDWENQIYPKCNKPSSDNAIRFWHVENATKYKQYKTNVQENG